MHARPLRILLIDDDRDDEFMFRDLVAQIRAPAWRVDWAPTYDQGLATLLSAQHDICFLDYRLGRETGLDLLKAAVAAGCRIPIVLLTGYGEEEVDQAAASAGAADYLVKDRIDVVTLDRCIRYAIHRAETLSTLRDREAQVLMQDRLASVGLLASSLAHEIGTPLGVVRGRAEYLAMQPRDQDTVSKNCDIIISQIDRVSGLIRSLLALARGDGTREQGEIDVRGVVDEVAELLEHVFTKNGIRFQNLLPGPLMVRAEQAPLHQVFLNLMVNSVHAIETAIAQGRKAEHFVQVSARSDGARWSIAVQDSGCGVSEANLRNLFKPFFTTKEVGAGTGLGLVTSYRIIESWGGTLEVESREGAGATFRILLPKPEAGKGV
jgi:signal transduction histidine kinase